MTLPKIGKYQLLRKIATGGMAEVFLAKVAGPMGYEKTLVVKRILPHLAEDPRFVAMFLTEAKVASNLSHPNIVQIFEFGQTDGAYFIAMEFIDGPNLRAIIHQANEQKYLIPLGVCAKIISYASEGLAYAHDHRDPVTGAPVNLIHRDLSPDNILVATHSGAVKVVDFGIAKAATQTHKTETGVVKGKFAYISPEQLETKGLDRRADVYSLGAVLYELVSLTKAHEGDNDLALMHSILYKPLTPIQARRPEVPEELARIIHRALERDREQRYQSCRELQADLERFVVQSGEAPGALPIAQMVELLDAGYQATIGAPTPLTPEPPPSHRARTTDHGLPTVDMRSAQEPAVAPPEVPPQAPKRPWAIAGVAGALLIAGVAGATVAIWSAPVSPPQPVVANLPPPPPEPAPAPKVVEPPPVTNARSVEHRKKPGKPVEPQRSLVRLNLRAAQLVRVSVLFEGKRIECGPTPCSVTLSASTGTVYLEATVPGSKMIKREAFVLPADFSASAPEFDHTLDLRKGSVEIHALGENPTLDGESIEPVSSQEIFTGAHTLTIQCPDGARKTEFNVSAGSSSERVILSCL